MPDMSVTIQGVDQFVKKYTPLQRNQILQAPMERGVERIKGFMAKYPDQKNPNSRYIRGRGWADADGRVRVLTSENLGKRWATRVTTTGNGLIGKVGNNASYGPFVQSDAFQASVHRGWWQTDRDAIRQNRRVIVRDFEGTIQRAIR